MYFVEIIRNVIRLSGLFILEFFLINQGSLGFFIGFIDRNGSQRLFDSDKAIKGIDVEVEIFVVGFWFVFNVTLVALRKMDLPKERILVLVEHLLLAFQVGDRVTFDNFVLKGQVGLGIQTNEAFEIQNSNEV